MPFLHYAPWRTLTPSGCSEQVTFCLFLLNNTAGSGTWCKVVVTMEAEISLILHTAQGCQAHMCGRAGLVTLGGHGRLGTGDISVCKHRDPEQLQWRISIGNPSIRWWKSRADFIPLLSLRSSPAGTQMTTHKPARGSQRLLQAEEISCLLPRPVSPLSPKVHQILNTLEG